MKHSVCSLNYSVLTQGECKGFFRIPQVTQFVTYAHRKFTETQASQLSTSIAELSQLADLLPIYEEAGDILLRMHRTENESAASNSDPTMQRPASPQLSESATSTIESHSSVIEENTGLTAPMQELVQFVTVSAMLDDFSGELKSHEKEYNSLINRNPETYSVFREQNPTYELMRSQLRRNDQFYLSKLILWRVYVWGLDIEIQNRLRLDKVKNAKQFYRKWSEVKNEEGEYAVTVTTYGGQFYPNVPKDLQGMQAIWDGERKLWSEWIIKNFPQKFSDAHNAIASAKMFIYTNGTLSRILLLGDLVCESIVVLPTAKELASLILKANSGAIRGLQLLGLECHTLDQIAEAIQRIRHDLDVGLSQSVKDLFRGGEVGLFDVEHLLCKVGRKQRRRNSKSPVWGTKLNEQGLKTKAGREETIDIIHNVRKRRKGVR